MALVEDLSCPVCTEVFRDPVVLYCGHSFCRQCINDHWAVSSRNCPICRQVSPQRPVSNLGLRNACESYLRECSTERDRDGGVHCDIHGETIQLFCQRDEQAICSECKKHEHRGHAVQPLQQAIRKRKGKLKAALRPAEKTLLSLQNGTAQENKISKYIQGQAQQTEKTIREEFEKLHHFLRKEEESRIAALKEEEEEKRGKMERRVKGGILSLSDIVRDLQEGMRDNDITFLQNYYSLMNRTEYTLPDAELSSESLIFVPKHLGNLRYKVWEKMKDICPFYPVILDPNTAPADFSVSDDLSCVTLCLHRQNNPSPLPMHRNRMILGSVGFGEGIHTWEIEVGNSRHWTLGVCLGPVERSIVQPLTPASGFWGLRCDGDSYRLLSAVMTIRIQMNPEVVRVKLGYHNDSNEMYGKRWRKVSFFDARSDSLIGEFTTEIPTEKELFPFVIPEDHSCPLRVVPANISLTVEQKLSFFERHEVLIKICFCCVIAIIIILCQKMTDK